MLSIKKAVRCCCARAARSRPAAVLLESLAPRVAPASGATRPPVDPPPADRHDRCDARGSGSPGALSGEAPSAATGDIPDNQVFLVFHNQARRLLDQVPGGVDAAGQRRRRHVQGQEQPRPHLHRARGGAHRRRPSPRSSPRSRRTTPSLTFTAPQPIQIGSATAVKAKYTTKSAPNPVTGKRVTLMVDRYELARNGRVAVVDLGTPVGVDNVDAYRMMIQSFTWR